MSEDQETQSETPAQNYRKQKEEALMLIGAQQLQIRQLENTVLELHEESLDNNNEVMIEKAREMDKLKERVRTLEQRNRKVSSELTKLKKTRSETSTQKDQTEAPLEE